MDISTYLVLLNYCWAVSKNNIIATPVEMILHLFLGIFTE